MKKRLQRECASIAAIFIIGFALCLCGCGKGKEAQGPQAPKVIVSKPEKRNITDYLNITGNTQAVQTVQLTARVSGYLRSVNFKDGDIVNEGDLLFVIEPEPYEAKVRLSDASMDSAQADLTRAQLEYQRQLDLVKKNATSQTEVEKWLASRNSAQAALDQAKANLDLANIDLGYTQVKAPFTGRMDRHLKDPGALVGAGEATVLSTIDRIDPIYAYFNVNEKDLVRIRERNAEKGAPKMTQTVVPAFLAIEGEKGYPHRGALDFASTSLDTGTGTLLMRGTFENPRISDAAPLILPGMFVRLRIPVGEENDAMVLPDKAIGSDQGGRMVLVVGEGNVVGSKSVVVGALQDDGMRVIESGLNGDEQVIVDGLARARVGFPVAPVKKDGAAQAQPQEKK